MPANKRVIGNTIVELIMAVHDAKPLLEHYENQLASSLSCDDRSHSMDRKFRYQLQDILNALARLKGAVAAGDPEEEVLLHIREISETKEPK